jgi:hypothetical protein
VSDWHYDRQVAVLNHLRSEVNLTYGYRNFSPRINQGPCGRFAKEFREQWNSRFKEKINIAFVMSADGTDCYHVLVKLPNGEYFDGGNGVIPGPNMLQQYPAGTRIDEMIEYDLKRLDDMSHGLNRNYEFCPNYSDETTAKLIRNHLSMLPP